MINITEASRDTAENGHELHSDSKVCVRVRSCKGNLSLNCLGFCVLTINKQQLCGFKIWVEIMN